MFQPHNALRSKMQQYQYQDHNGKDCTFCNKKFRFLDNRHFFDTGHILCDACFSAMERRKADKAVNKFLDRWQYKAVTAKNPEALNALGHEGWELVSVIKTDQNQSSRSRSKSEIPAFIFKRRM